MIFYFYFMSLLSSAGVDGAVQFDKDPICPCVRPAGSSICFTYDQQYQAVDLTEAVVHFVNPVTIDSNATAITNTSEIDQDCIGKAVKGNNLNLNDLEKMKKKCRRGYLSSEEKKQSKEEGSRESENRKRRPPKHPHMLDLSEPHRKPRQANETTLMHTVISVECRKKGEPVTDGSQFCGLCDNCWQWVVLPDYYFPQVVNQMACGNVTSCLSENGSCKQRYKAVKVMHNIGTAASPNWIEENMNVPLACDCQVSQNSAIFSMVTK